jgi:hypothetical protein
VDVIKLAFFSTVAHEVDGLVDEMQLLYFAEFVLEELYLNHVQNVIMVRLVPFSLVVHDVHFLFLDYSSFVFVGQRLGKTEKEIIFYVDHEVISHSVRINFTYILRIDRQKL